MRCRRRCPAARICLDGGDAAVGLEPGADAYLRGVSHAARDELVLAGVLAPHRAPSPLRQHGRDPCEASLVLVAVARAQERPDDPHPVAWEPQCPGQRVPVHVDAAGGLPDGQSRCRHPRSTTPAQRGAPGGRPSGWVSRTRPPAPPRRPRSPRRRSPSPAT